MKLSVQSATLLAQLGAVARVASTRSAVQALSGVQVLAGADGVELRATDMEVGLRVPLQAQVEREGDVVLPARLLLDVARALPAGEVVVEHRPSEGDVQLVTGSATFALRTLRAEDFPPFPEPGGEAVRLPAGAFVATVAKVARSASRDETRPILTGILVDAAGSDLRMVATDSYRLSVQETRLDAPLEGEFNANVPARALQELARLAQGAEGGELAVSREANQVVFDVDGVVLSSRLIEGQFPNYRQLLPEDYEHELTLVTDEVRDVVRRMSLMAQRNAPLRLRFSEGELTVSAQTPDVGQAQETLPVPFAGEPFEIGFNPDFLRDGLDSVDTDDVRVKLISPLRPGLLEAGDQSGFLYLIMPIRLNV